MSPIDGFWPLGIWSIGISSYTENQYNPRSGSRSKETKPTPWVSINSAFLDGVLPAPSAARRASQQLASARTWRCMMQQVLCSNRRVVLRHENAARPRWSLQEWGCRQLGLRRRAVPAWQSWILRQAGTAGRAAGNVPKNRRHGSRSG
jgi:hypothetical protein